MVRKTIRHIRSPTVAGTTATGSGHAVLFDIATGMDHAAVDAAYRVYSASDTDLGAPGATEQPSRANGPP